MEEQKIHYAQPWSYDLKTGCRLTAKGDPQPEVELRISRKFEDEKQVVVYLEKDFEDSIKKVKEAIKKLKELDEI